MSYSTGQVAKLARVTVRTLRHYDQTDLLHPSGRQEVGAWKVLLQLPGTPLMCSLAIRMAMRLSSLGLSLRIYKIQHLPTA